MSDPVEVRRLPTAERVVIVGVMIAGAGFFYWLTLTHRTHDSWIGYVTSGLALWAALYWMRAPAVLARADDSGIAYADTRWGVLLVFGDGQAAWSDVVGVNTHRVSSRSGTYLSTRVTLRGEGGVGTRRFSVTSRSAGYLEFLDSLHAHTTGVTVEQKGLGDDPTRARDELARMAVWRERKIVILFVILVAMFVVLFALQRRG